MEDGGYVVGPERSGGAFDPLGCRSVDVHRADDLVAAVEALGTGWKFVTLTIDRAGFLSPETAYLRCQERVRKLARLVSRVWCAGLEVQTKTGDGWPHWHLLIYAPGQSAAQVAAVVRRAWCVREVYAEHFDPATGEVSQRRRRASIGMVDVQEAGSVSGVARYVAKYIVKAWEAVPAWMGESTRRMRKGRFSQGFYEVLERLHRHQPHPGSRKPAGSGRRPGRTMFERMARSGSRVQVFRRDGERLRYAGWLPCPVAEFSKVAAEVGAPARVLGGWGRVRWVVPVAAWPTVAGRARALAPEAERHRLRELQRLRAAWELMQHQRAEREGRVEESPLAWVPVPPCRE